MTGVDAAASNWAVLWPVIIGGVLALLGGAIPPVVTHWLNVGSENRKKRNEHLEALVNAVYEHDHWLDLERRNYIWKGEEQAAAQPVQKAAALAAIYFPSLSKPISDLNLASGAYKVWIYQAASRRARNELASTLNEGFEEVYNPYYAQLAKVIAEVSRIAGAKKV
ncbi:hypothetical protein [Rhizobium sp. S96]|uniref:hypothetical protein n=1 Tax=Rhizobium sp. S96 TaxID=3055140 RepID=UPI0025AB435F|nr:hypothetical protein [Rhizobium sp. S96]MDM9619063.1 hypothetical protein [Rhizobium sp. S96]